MTVMSIFWCVIVQSVSGHLCLRWPAGWRLCDAQILLDPRAMQIHPLQLRDMLICYVHRLRHPFGDPLPSL